MKNITTTLTIISIAVTIIGIIRADLIPLGFNGEYGQPVSTVTTTNSITSSIANATSYGGGRTIAISNPVKENPATPILPLPTAKRTVKQTTKDEQKTSVINDDSAAHLIISATGSEITIKEGDPDFPYPGGVISSVAVEQVVFLPKGQLLVVSLSGTGAELAIARSISKQLTINNSGVGAEVSVF